MGKKHRKNIKDFIHSGRSNLHYLKNNLFNVRHYVSQNQIRKALSLLTGLDQNIVDFAEKFDELEKINEKLQ